MNGTRRAIDDKTVVATALKFAPQQLYCLLTYLKSAASLSASSTKTRTDENGETVYIAQAIKAVDAAVSYAFNSPLIEHEHLSTEIIAVYEEAQKYLPDTAHSMFAASAMYALFNTPSIPDYGIEDLAVVIEDYDLQQYPALLPLINDLVSFRESTGYGMDSFAGYKTDTSILQKAVSDAVECRNAVEERIRSSEQYVQLRQTREMLFSDANGYIRKCLDIAAENRTSECDTIIKTMQKLFIRTGHIVSSENIDKNKIKAYIDKTYKQASDVIVDNGCQPSKQFKILVGKRANNLFTVTLRTIGLRC